MSSLHKQLKIIKDFEKQSSKVNLVVGGKGKKNKPERRTPLSNSYANPYMEESSQGFAYLGSGY